MEETHQVHLQIALHAAGDQVMLGADSLTVESAEIEEIPDGDDGGGRSGGVPSRLGGRGDPTSPFRPCEVQPESCGPLHYPGIQVRFPQLEPVDTAGQLLLRTSIRCVAE